MRTRFVFFSTVRAHSANAFPPSRARFFFARFAANQTRSRTSALDTATTTAGRPWTDGRPACSLVRRSYATSDPRKIRRTLCRDATCTPSRGRNLRTLSSSSALYRGPWSPADLAKSSAKPEPYSKPEKDADSIAWRKLTTRKPAGSKRRLIRVIISVLLRRGPETPASRACEIGSKDSGYASRARMERRVSLFARTVHPDPAGRPKLDINRTRHARVGR